MKRMWIALVVFLIAAPVSAKQAKRLLVCNKADDTVSFVDTKTLKVVGTATTGRGPHEIVVGTDGKWAYVANYEGGNSISLIDIERMKEIKQVSLDPYESPHGITANKKGTLIYATTEGTQCLIEFDVASQKVLRRFDTNHPITHMLVLTPDEKKIYATDIGRGVVAIIDVAKGAKAKQIESGKGCEGIDITPNGNEVWTTNRADDTVSIIDTEKDIIIDSIQVGGFPIRVKITPDGKHALVSCPTKNSVVVIDVGTREVIKRIDVGAAPIGIVIEPDSKRAYIANTQANTVMLLDLKKLEVVGEVEAGNTPDGMALVVD